MNKFDLNTCTAEELLNQCRLANIKQKDHQFLIDYFLNKKSAIEMARENPCYTDRYYRDKAYKLKRRLEKTINSR